VVGVAHLDAATGGATLATALKDGVTVATWDELFRLVWWPLFSFSVTAVATAPTTTTTAVAIAAMVTALRRRPPRPPPPSQVEA